MSGRWYTIRVTGALGATALSAFPEFASHVDGSITTLTGEMPDSAALYGTVARLEALGERLALGLSAGARAAGIPLTVNRVGSMLTGFFCAGPVTDYATAKRADTARYARFFHALLARGVYVAPSQFEAAFVSLAHTDADIDDTLDAVATAATALAATASPQ